jgi:hypothetical protein
MTNYEVVNSNGQSCGHKHKTADAAENAEKNYRKQLANIAGKHTADILE